MSSVVRKICREPMSTMLSNERFVKSEGGAAFNQEGRGVQRQRVIEQMHVVGSA